MMRGKYHPLVAYLAARRGGEALLFRAMNKAKGP
jgi:hypothetical protein